jgi:hypothetical protein
VHHVRVLILYYTTSAASEAECFAAVCPTESFFMTMGHSYGGTHPAPRCRRSSLRCVYHVDVHCESVRPLLALVQGWLVRLEKAGARWVVATCLLPSRKAAPQHIHTGTGTRDRVQGRLQ